MHRMSFAMEPNDTTPLTSKSTEYLKVYAPLMIDDDWAHLACLPIILLLSVFGTIMNWFFLTSYRHERVLRKFRNIYIACNGIADSLMTTGVLFPLCLVIIDRQWNNKYICKVGQIIASTSTYAYRIYFLMAALSSDYYYWNMKKKNGALSKINIPLTSIFIAIICFAMGVADVIYDLDYDHCERRSNGNFIYRSITVVLGTFCTLLTLICLYFAKYKALAKVKDNIFPRHSKSLKEQYELAYSNYHAFKYFTAAWAPYWFILNVCYNASDVYFNTVWIGLLRSVFTSAMYGYTNSIFNQAYKTMFEYCCCKGQLVLSEDDRPMELTPAKKRRRYQETSFIEIEGASTSRNTQSL